MLTRARLLAVCGIVAFAVIGCKAYDESLVRVERGQKRRSSSVREEPADAGADGDAAVLDGASGDSSHASGGGGPGNGSRAHDAGVNDERASRGDASAENAEGAARGGSGAGAAGAAGHVDEQKPSDAASPNSGGDVGTAASAGSGASTGAAGAATGGGAGAAGSAGAPGGGRDVACSEANARISDANDHCYFVLSVPNSWYVSRDRCRELRAHLVSIASADEQTFVSSLVGSSPAWIGLSRFGAPAFSWVDGQSLTYENWEMNAPHLMNEAAVALRPQTFFWFDDPVSQQYQAICERE